MPPPTFNSPPQPDSQESCNNYFQNLLASVRPFLRGELENIDKNLPSLLSVLCSVGAAECSHKLGSFFEHLFGVYRTLKIWKAPDVVCLCGLFHSSYSNAYVNLAIFDPNTGRDVVRGHVGDAAERLIHLFCIVPRHPIIHDDLLFKYTETELVQHLAFSETSLKNAKEKGLFNGEETWRKKINTLLPPAGITVKHIRTGEDVLVTRRMVAIFLIMTMADLSDQLTSWQDLLHGNYNGKREFSKSDATALWPGDGKPGLWMNSVSQIGAVYTLIRREEKIFIEERKRRNGIEVDVDRDENIELVVPPVFDNCTRILDAKDQIEARDLYWEGVCDMSKRGLDKVEEWLLSSIEKNPFVGEPRVVLAQVYLTKGRFEEAEKMAEKGATLLLEWGSPWDKRRSWEGWVAWSRVLLLKANEKSWPNTNWGIINLGLV